MRQALELSPHLFASHFRDEWRSNSGWAVETAAPTRTFHVSMHDVKAFLMTYCVCFVGALAFIA